MTQDKEPILTEEYLDSELHQLRDSEIKEIVKRYNEYPKLKEKWELYVKISRDGFYSFDCEPEDRSVWGGCVKREKIDQTYQQIADKINECIKLKEENEELKKKLEEYRLRYG